jgi:enoyl-[acyl-carrier protein] reductase II
VGALRRAAIEGDKQNGCFLAGQISGMVNKEMTAAEIIEEVVGECETILKGAASWVK